LAFPGCASVFEVADVVSLGAAGCEASAAGGAAAVFVDALDVVVFDDVSGVGDGMASRVACESCVDAGVAMVATHC
jgi:hypothetical protein